MGYKQRETQTESPTINTNNGVMQVKAGKPKASPRLSFHFLPRQLASRFLSSPAATHPMFVPLCCHGSRGRRGSGEIGNGGTTAHGALSTHTHSYLYIMDLHPRSARIRQNTSTCARIHTVPHALRLTILMYADVHKDGMCVYARTHACTQPSALPHIEFQVQH